MLQGFLKKKWCTIWFFCVLRSPNPASLSVASAAWQPLVLWYSEKNRHPISVLWRASGISHHAFDSSRGLAKTPTQNFRNLSSCVALPLSHTLDVLSHTLPLQVADVGGYKQSIWRMSGAEHRDLPSLDVAVLFTWLQQPPKSMGEQSLSWTSNRWECVLENILQFSPVDLADLYNSLTPVWKSINSIDLETASS